MVEEGRDLRVEVRAHDRGIVRVDRASDARPQELGEGMGGQGGDRAREEIRSRAEFERRARVDEELEDRVVLDGLDPVADSVGAHLEDGRADVAGDARD